MPAQSPLLEVQAGGRQQSWHRLGLSWRCVLSRDGAQCSSGLSPWQGKAFLEQVLLGWIHHMQIQRTLWASVQGSCIS